MKEKEVVEIIGNYLRKEKAGMVFIRSNFDVDWRQVPIEIKGSSITLGRPHDLIQIECKGSNSDIDRTIGQCLRYSYENKCIRTYVAIPEDHEKLYLIHEICDYYNLPIGIMRIDSNQQVKIARKLRDDFEVAEPR